MKEERFPHTRKALRRQRWRVAGGEDSEPQRRVQQQGCSKVERFPHRGSVPTSTQQPVRLVCSPTGMGGGWELRLGLRRSDPRERTGIGCMNTA